MSIDERSMRDALGSFATGVCLVTVTDDEGVAHAMTVNSFAAVSLEPPLVLWSLQNSSDGFDLYAHAHRSAIAVLREDQVTLSTLYATKGEHLLEEEHFDIGENGAPLIRGALVNFECSLEQVLPGGDHLILLQRVTRLVEGEQHAPLVFFAGEYRQIP